MEIKYIGYIQLLKELLKLDFFKKSEKDKNAIVLYKKPLDNAPAFWREMTIGEYAEELANSEAAANDLFAAMYTKRMTAQFDEDGYFVCLLRADTEDLPIAYSEDYIRGCLETVPSLTVKLRHIFPKNFYNLIEAANIYYTATGVHLPNQAFSKPFFDELTKATDYVQKEAYAVDALSPYCRLVMGVKAFHTKAGVIKLPEAGIQFGKDEPLIQIYGGFISEDGKSCFVSVKKHSEDWYKSLTVGRAAAVVSARNAASDKNKNKAGE